MYKIISFFTILLLFSSALFSCTQPTQEIPKQEAPKSPTSFNVSNLNINPTAVSPGDTVTITVDIMNTGGTTGSRTIELKINGNTETTQTVDLEAGVSKKVNFTFSPKTAGDYTVAVDSLTGQFTATSPQPQIKSVTWTDEDFNTLSHILTGKTEYNYEIHLINDNQMVVHSAIDFTFLIDVRDGKLCFSRVDPMAWSYVYIAAKQYLTYDNGLMTCIALPDKVLKSMIAPDIDTLPIIESATTSDGKITITYRAPQK